MKDAATAIRNWSSSVVTPGDVVRYLRAIDQSAEPDTAMTLWGDPDRSIRHVFVTWSASVSHLRAAADAGDAMVVTRVHPFYETPASWDPAMPAPNGFQDGPGRDLDLLERKRALISESGVFVAFAPEAWDADGASGLSDALARRFDIADPVPSAEPSAVVLGLPAPLTVAEFGRLALSVTRRSRALVTGDKERRVRRVGVLAGVADPVRIRNVLQDTEVDCLLTGETIEWEGTPYVQDSIAAGRGVAMVAIGNSASEDPASERVAARIAGAFPGIAVAWLRADDATWSPTGIKEVRS